MTRLNGIEIMNSSNRNDKARPGNSARSAEACPGNNAGRSRKRKSCIVILLDGIGDRAHEILGNRTPLQAARTPVLDRLAAMGANGLYHAAAFGQALPSENAHFAMFGYDLFDFPGRGALEALGAGIPMSESEVAILAHFASVSVRDGGLILGNSKPPWWETEAEDLARAVGEFETGGVRIRFHRTHKLNGILMLDGNVSRYVTDTDPFIAGQPIQDVAPWQSHARDTNALNTVRALKTYLRWAHDRLNRHPLNEARKHKGLTPVNWMDIQRAGQLKPVVPFREKYGMAGVCLASGLVYAGLSKFIGMDIHKVKDTGDPGTDIAERLKFTANLLDTHDFIHVHTKTPDEAAHAKDPELKKQVIESLDTGIGPAIEPFLRDPDVLLVITADHSTPSSGALIHSG